MHFNGLTMSPATDFIFFKKKTIFAHQVALNICKVKHHSGLKWAAVSQYFVFAIFTQDIGGDFHI